MKRRFLFFPFLMVFLTSQAQTWVWERSIFHGYTLASNVIVDKLGNSYLLTNDSSLFGDAKNNIIRKIGDPSLIKISPTGTLVWTAAIHSSVPAWLISSFQYIGAINITRDGNIVVCAALPGALNFGIITIPVDARHPIPNDFQKIKSGPKYSSPNVTLRVHGYRQIF